MTRLEHSLTPLKSLSVLATVSLLSACGGKTEESSTPDYCGRLQQAVCNCDGSFGDDYDGDDCDEAVSYTHLTLPTTPYV